MFAEHLPRYQQPLPGFLTSLPEVAFTVQPDTETLIGTEAGPLLALVTPSHIRFRDPVRPDDFFFEVYVLQAMRMQRLHMDVQTRLPGQPESILQHRLHAFDLFKRSAQHFQQNGIFPSVFHGIWYEGTHNWNHLHRRRNSSASETARALEDAFSVRCARHIGLHHFCILEDSEYDEDEDTTFTRIEIYRDPKPGFTINLQTGRYD
ncbi:MAG: hypothetical protein TR69_WS6001001529 [candidate division WS6 bacterium OLB20]|uniref:Uncharacterized protein n=1 Tax=candidate division WS6 bacterium OLB20 TaxID=1617426 RepID=A0A136LVQ3_9BACT|nr:MAG: hypothetical protein TR69_WS6001001529 [candidate division WS6 bacterium OLB20]